jgi:hypothetical protein
LKTCYLKEVMVKIAWRANVRTYIKLQLVRCTTVSNYHKLKLLMREPI